MTQVGRGLAAVVLAAGKGTRMRSDLPKVVHPVVGRPMVEHVVRTARDAGATQIVVVVGFGADAVRSALARYDVTFVEQSEQRGTGHAVACARSVLEGRARAVAVLYGDGPALRSSTLRSLATHLVEPLDVDPSLVEWPDVERPDVGAAGARQASGLPSRSSRPGMVLATVTRDDAGGFGRIVRGPHGDVERIVEQADATPDEVAIREVNPGIYVFDDTVWTHVERLGSGNAQGEIYLTDVIASYRAAGERVVAVPLADASEAMAANDRAQLAELEGLLRRRIVASWMERGVTFVMPDATTVADDVVLAPDVTVGPFTVLSGGTTVGAGASIDSHVSLHACTVEPGVTVPAGTVARSERFA